jgi:hypothetical protein
MTLEQAAKACCGPFHVDVYAGGDQITARYTPASGMTLEQAAKACGYEGFNWVQQVTNLPCPSPAALTTNTPGILPSANYCGPPTKGSLTAGGKDSPPFNDPPPSGVPLFGKNYNPYPFYYPVELAETPNKKSVQTNIVVNNDNKFLGFGDKVVDFCLPTGGVPPTAEKKKYCGNSLAPNGSFVSFTTDLVGIIAPTKILEAPTPSKCLYRFTWTSTYNGVAGKTTITSSGPCR